MMYLSVEVFRCFKNESIDYFIVSCVKFLCTVFLIEQTGPWSNAASIFQYMATQGV